MAILWLLTFTTKFMELCPFLSGWDADTKAGAGGAITFLKAEVMFVENERGLCSSMFPTGRKRKGGQVYILAGRVRCL